MSAVSTRFEANHKIRGEIIMNENIRFKNNGKLKLLIIVGTRPEIIRLAAVINKARKYFDTILAHTGQNYDYNLNGVFFRDLQLDDPDVYLNAVGADLGETMGNIIAASYKAMVELKPDAVLVLGDTNSCLSVIGAKRLHIPIFHMEAGNRCKANNLRAGTYNDHQLDLTVFFPFCHCIFLLSHAPYGDHLVTNMFIIQKKHKQRLA